jgi:hypothetical protein
LIFEKTPYNSKSLLSYCLLPSHASKYGYATLREQKSKRIPISRFSAYFYKIKRLKTEFSTFASLLLSSGFIAPRVNIILYKKTAQSNKFVVKNWLLGKIEAKSTQQTNSFPRLC